MTLQVLQLVDSSVPRLISRRQALAKAFPTLGVQTKNLKIEIATDDPSKEYPYAPVSVK